MYNLKKAFEGMINKIRKIKLEIIGVPKVFYSRTSIADK